VQVKQLKQLKARVKEATSDQGRFLERRHLARNIGARHEPAEAGAG
jgi:hypothetical protein